MVPIGPWGIVVKPRAPIQLRHLRCFLSGSSALLIQKSNPILISGFVFIHFGFLLLAVKVARVEALLVKQVEVELTAFEQPLPELFERRSRLGVALVLDEALPDAFFLRRHGAPAVVEAGAAAALAGHHEVRDRAVLAALGPEVRAQRLA